MRDKFLRMTPELYTYMVDHGARQDELLARVEQETEALGSIAVMQIAPDQGALLTLLAQLVGARRALEIGTFTGYSAMCIARGLPREGRLVCCEIDENWAAAAERNCATPRSMRWSRCVSRRRSTRCASSLRRSRSTSPS